MPERVNIIKIYLLLKECQLTSLYEGESLINFYEDRGLTSFYKENAGTSFLRL